MITGASSARPRARAVPPTRPHARLPQVLRQPAHCLSNGYGKANTSSYSEVSA